MVMAFRTAGRESESSMAHLWYFMVFAWVFGGTIAENA